MAAPDPLPAAPPPGPAAPLTRYQRKLMLFLSVATFFEGFDFFALSQLLPQLRAAFALGEQGAGLLVGAINVGPMLAYLLVRKADQWGRRPVLTLTIAGYTLFTLLSAAAWSAWSFAAFQLLARIFLIGEWAVAMVFAAEEYPADRRGLVIGVIQACSSLGGVVCAGVVPLLLRTPLGWRAVFLVGAGPLLAVAIARRGIQETARFRERPAVAATPGLMRIWRTPWRGRVLLLAAIWGLTYACTTSAVLFWKEFAVAERGFSDAQVGASMTIAALVAMPLVFGVGRFLDAVGRKPASTVIFLLAAAAVLGAYNLQGRAALTAALTAGIFGASAVLPVLNAFTTELFPTDLRSDAFAWANNLLGRTGAALAPVAIGAGAALHGWGPAMTATCLGPVLALGLILWRLPETRGLELERTSAL